MAKDIDMTHEISALSCEVSPGLVDAGADMILKCTVSCSPAGDLRGQIVAIKDQDGASVQRIELSGFDGKTNETSECPVKAPGRPGSYTWLAVRPADAKADASCEQTSAPFSFTVKPHSTHVVVWDAPSAIECGERFSVKLGAKCSSECPPDGWALEVRDHDGKKLARATLSDDPWPGTTALYYTEADLTAPETAGQYAWEAEADVAGLDVPHAAGVTSFGVRVVPAPECLLTVVAVDRESQTPVEGAKVVVHPYRAFTDERGVAQVSVPKGEYRIFVSGRNYCPFRSDGEVKMDMIITAELALDRGPSDAELWS